MASFSSFAALVFVSTALSAVAGRAEEAASKTAVKEPPPGSLEAVIANNPISAVLQGPRLWTTPADPKPWVKDTRTNAPLEYMPVGVTPPRRTLKVKTAAELAIAKAGLEADSAAMANIAAHKPVLGAAPPPPPAPPPAHVAGKAARPPARISLNKPPLPSGSFSPTPAQ